MSKTDRFVDDGPPVEIIRPPRAKRSARTGPASFGRTAVSGDPWLRDRAQHILTHGLPRLPPHLREQPRDSHGRFDFGDGGEDSGGDPGYAAIVDTYGPTVDEWQPMADENSMIAVHENGDISVSFADEDNELEVWGDFDADSAQGVSDRVAVFEADASGYNSNASDATPVSPNGLVDWSEDNNVLVGYTPDEEIAIGWKSDANADSTASLDGYDMHYLTTDEAQDFADFLGQAAEMSDEIAHPD